MGAKVIIFGQSLNSQFLKGLTHSAVVLLLAPQTSVQIHPNTIRPNVDKMDENG